MNSFLSRLLGARSTSAQASATPEASLAYEKLIPLDAEDLAELGIAEAYEKLLPELSAYVDHPVRIEEEIDESLPSYAVRFNGVTNVIHSAALEGSEAESWGRATYVLFAIVNDQLAESDVRFYAVDGGNDLGGIFLTAEQAQSAQAGLKRKSDWPYIPNLSGPYYGQHH